MGRTPQRLPLHLEFGQRVRSRRHELGWTIERLAEEAGLHWSYVGQTERGERNVGMENICKLAAGLGVGAGQLMADLERLL
jgi:transcriptional regulator with XRE-family HTH domain